ncbi:MAG: hypothetical protein H6936_01285 [Burkholderiales bacterium]|nr:hypothetical protein [Burkholderiales bacterium]
MLDFSPTLFCEKNTSIQIQIIKAWLFRIGEPEEDHCIVLNKCKNDPEAMAYFLEQAQGSKVITEPNSDDRQQKVLSMLADNPDKQRVYITDDKTDSDNVILTVAIRDLFSFEMLIPKEKYDPFGLIDLINGAQIQ